MIFFRFFYISDNCSTNTRVTCNSLISQRGDNYKCSSIKTQTVRATRISVLLYRILVMSDLKHTIHSVTTQLSFLISIIKREANLILYHFIK